MEHKLYRVRCGPAADWERAERAPIAPCRFSPFPPPEAWAQAVYVPGTGLLLRLTARETPPPARNTLPDSPVYEDSCLECFLSPGEGRAYLNMEVNSAGALLCGYGPDRRSRRRVRELPLPCPAARAVPGQGQWSALITLPEATLTALFGLETPGPGLRLLANFYKCGDRTPRPHYGAWSPVETPSPDFHRPEFFGTLALD